MYKIKFNLRNAAKIVAILVVFSVNNLLAQDKVEIPKWLSTQWYGQEAKFTEEWLFEVTNKGEIKYKTADAKETDFKTGQITAVEEKTKPAPSGNNMSGSFTYTIDGKTFTVNYSDYTTNAYGLPAYLDVRKITIKGAQANDPIFGKLATDSYKFRSSRDGIAKRPVVREKQPEKPGKLPAEIIGKFYTKSKSAYCQKENDLIFEIMADGTFKYKKDNEWVSGTIKLIKYQKDGSVLKGNDRAAYDALRIEIDGNVWYDEKYDKRDYVDGVNVKGNQVSMSALNCWSPDKNITVISAGREAANSLWREGKYYYSVKKAAKPGECEEFDERVVAMWYMDKPKSAQWGQDRLFPENKFWDFLIVEENGKYYYRTPDMVDSSKPGTKNKISNPGEGVLKMGKNEMTYQLDGNKIQVKGASGSGFTMGAQIKSGTYYKYDPDGPTVDEAEVMIEIGKQAVDMFKK